MGCFSFCGGQRKSPKDLANNPNATTCGPAKPQPPIQLQPQTEPQKGKMADNQHDQAQNQPPSYQSIQEASSSALDDPSSKKSYAAAPEPNPPPYHNWQEAVPDTTTFPPPPVGGYLDSNAGNASADDAERAHRYCDATPLWHPVKPSTAVFHTVQEHDLRPVIPPEFRGTLSPVFRGRWHGFTNDGNGDCIVMTNLPLYFPVADSPIVTKSRKTVYFEVKILGLHDGPGTTDSSGLSIGYVAQPYPSWRSPGWERGGLGVFSDDGCRFVNDSWGGREFTSEFRVGETVGLGMTFSLPDKGMSAAQMGGQKLAVDIFFTRNGQRTGGWELHEEVDADAGGIEGLEGNYDLYGAVGLFGGVDFEVCFDPAGWLWRYG